MVIAVGDTKFVRVEVDRGVALLTVDRPPANALDLQVVHEISRAASETALQPEVGAIVVTGHGKQFVAGADIKVMRDIDLAGFAYFVNAIQRALNDLEALPLPVIAAINGNAMGGGLELALACDLRFAGEHVRLGVPEVRLGLLPGAGGTQRLCETIGKGRALELLYTGRQVSAAEAHALGLVNRVVKPDELVAAAQALASEMASCVPHVLTGYKKLIDEGAGMSLPDALVYERQAGIESAKAISTSAISDRREGVQSRGREQSDS